MSTPCPPAPNYARALGIADCDYEQLTPFARSRLRRASVGTERLQDTANLSYAIGGFEMNHAQVAGTIRARRNPHCTGLMVARPNGRSLGRTVLDLSNAASWNGRNAGRYGWSVTSGYSGGASDPNLAKDVWATQVAQWWLSNGNAFADFEGNANEQAQAGARSRWGGSPSLPPRIVTNLSQVLPAIPAGTTVLGPDGRLGPAGLSVIANFIRSNGKVATNKAGTTNVTVPAGPYRQAFERLAARISSPVLTTARNNRDGRTGGVADTPCDALTAEARAARPDCNGGSSGSGGGGSNILGDNGDTNWLLIGGIGLLVAGAGVGTALYLKKRRGQSATPRAIASPIG